MTTAVRPRRGKSTPPPAKPTGRDYVAIATAYARDVVEGRILACKWTRLACERQLTDLERAGTADFPYRFDHAAAAKVCRFIELLKHIKGKWAGQPIRLEPWQCFILTTVFGWLHVETGLRRFRTSYIEVPRKNAKSTLTSGVALYMLTADGEGGAEVYSAATTRDQAKIVFADAQNMARRSPELRQAFGVEVGAHNIHVLATASKFEALSAEGNTLDGLNTHFGGIDELHAHRTRAVFDVIETSTGARAQSLLWNITTAGSNRAGICYEVRTYLTKLLERVETDETYFGVIYTIDDARTESVQSLRALRELDRLCSCGHVPTTQIEQSWRAACARHATTASAEQIRRSDAGITPTGPSGVAISVEAVTNSGSSTATQSGRLARSQSDSNGRAVTATASARRTPDGVRSPATSARFSTSNDASSTGLPERSTTLGTLNSMGAAQSATSTARLYAWITTTQQEWFADCSADSATLRSAFSETLQSIYSAHSPTCNARKAARIEKDALVVSYDGDDWRDPAVWAKANPNLGVSVYPDQLARLAQKAQAMASAVNNFLTKHLDVWVSADVAWMDMKAWDRCADASLDVADFEGEPCVLGLDLASKVDIAARVQLFERDLDGVRHYYAFGRYYLPEARIEDAGNSQYSGWEREGRLVATEGNVIDFGVIEQELTDLPPRFEIREVAYDPWQATELAQRMQAEGLPMVEVRQIVQNMSEPMKQLEALVLSGRFHHDGDPVLAWMVSNVVAHTDAKDNIYPKKERGENKIDGIVALLMALGRLIAQPITERSTYEDDGIFTL